MHPRRFALIAGTIMVITSLLSFLPGLNTDPATAGLAPLNVETSHGLFMNFLPMNIVTKVVLLAFGIWGIAASQNRMRSLPASRNWAGWVALGMGGLAILGAIPATNTLFGTYPLYGNVVWMNTVFSLLGLYFTSRLAAKAHANNQWLRDDREYTNRAA
jgi:hypothetical protein